MREDQKRILAMEIRLLEEACDVLEFSLNRCQAIGKKERFSFEELDHFEALTSRFSRTSDMLIQKVFRWIDTVELERPGSPIDRIHRAEKRGLTDSADTLKDIRALRNDIAHEYMPNEINRIFEKTLHFTPFLLDCARKTISYGHDLVRSE